MSETWSSVAFPVLKWIAAHEGGNPATIGDISDELGLEPMAVVNELDRLYNDGYITDEVCKTMTGGNPRPWHLYPIRLTGDGARAVGMWPSGDAADVLLEVLKRAEAAESDPERKGRLQRAVEALGGLAHDILVELAVSVAKGAAGIP